jgi:hypothetical protein
LRNTTVGGDLPLAIDDLAGGVAGLFAEGETVVETPPSCAPRSQTASRWSPMA